MSSTLKGKKVVVIGGTSGIGFGVAKLSLLALASEVVVASSSSEKVDLAVTRLQETAKDGNIDGRVVGMVVDARDKDSVMALFKDIGEFDHLVWTSTAPLQVGFANVDLEERRDLFDIMFWGAATAAQVAKIRPGGSITLSISTTLVQPRPNLTLLAGLLGAVDGLTRGLAVDLAPTRVNVVSPGLVKTEFWDRSGFSKESQEKLFADVGNKLPVKHVADADELAEAYLFCMKCSYITGQRIEVSGGATLIEVP